MALQERQLENNWYYVPDPPGLASLRSHGRKLKYILPFWFGVTESGTLVDQADAEGLAIIRQYNLPVLAIVHNYSSPQYGPLIHRLLTTPNLRRTLVNNILTLMYRWGFAGVNIDFEFVPPEDRPFLTGFMRELFQALRLAGFLTTISVPAELEDNPRHPFSGAFSYPELGALSDQVYILAYDEHFSTPGPIASVGFVRRVLDYAVTVIPREKIRLGMAVYGYDWAEGARTPRTLSHSQAIELARRLGVNIYYDEAAQESTFSYVEDNIPHVVWFEDVRSFSKKLELVREYNLPGIGVWRLGLEDPRIWELRASP
ncbi:Spore germination protein YaaH [Thermanaeromonas toyohensis ToBE]|uniref:Spore germination protein YaaH n=1 Tax=Thermanaeromonas toyohensis ToBE TaxID=698762 RepID=A0A1W1W1T6_9FIRM|nr:glycosyl hydrolase family 18 protein [Thermanaeromonas toyohensis]SMB99536.1 Spore germination protein YaaH [Thermanaeromonas toyohensis ToBE]